MLDALDQFLDTVVEPLEDESSELLRDPRQRYTTGGLLARPVLELKRRVRTAASAVGLYGLMLPPELGGPGLGWADKYEVWRHLYARCGPDRILPYDSVGSFTSGPGAALGGLSSQARNEVWPRILSGEDVLCFALSERTGSEKRHMRTTAAETGNGYVLQGEKTWVSRGGYADYALVYAATPDSSPNEPSATSAFLVPLAAPGVTVVSVALLLGRVGGEEVTLAFDDVTLSHWQLVGEVGEGAALAASGALSGTIFTGGRFVGLATWALHHAATTTGGATDPGNRSGMRLLAEAATEVHGVDLLARQCADQADSGDPARGLQTMVKIGAPQMCGRVYEKVMKIEGSDALTNSARLFDGWHQSCIVQVAQAALLDSMHDALARELVFEATSPRPGPASTNPTGTTQLIPE